MARTTTLKLSFCSLCRSPLRVLPLLFLGIYACWVILVFNSDGSSSPAFDGEDARDRPAAAHPHGAGAGHPDGSRGDGDHPPDGEPDWASELYSEIDPSNGAEAASAAKGHPDEVPREAEPSDNEGAHPSLRGAEAPAASADHQVARAGKLLIALATGVSQLQSTLVVLRSAAHHAADLRKLQFRLLALPDEVGSLLGKVRAHLDPDLDVDVVDFGPWMPRVMRLLGGKSSERAELNNALNFAAFYLHDVFPKADRVLYLDTDVVVLGDVSAKLTHLDFRGQVAAVAKDCSQQVGKYINFDKIHKIKVQSKLRLKILLQKKDCVINRGVVLINIAAWAKVNITGAIEELVQAHLTKSVGPLWRSGVSQPPFMLVLGGRYSDLGPSYNVRGLGRGDLAPDEVKYLKDQHLWQGYFDSFVGKCKVNCCSGCKGYALSPFVSAAADKAMILHFNGRLKPWKVARRSMAPVTPPPAKMSDKDRGVWEQTPLCSCGDKCLRECAGLWWHYLPPEAE